jgi:hypothetical protein
MTLFQSVQSKVMVLLAIVVIVVTQYRGFDMTKLLTQMLVFLALAYNVDCLVEGRCRAWAWITLAVPIIVIIGYLFFNQKLDLDLLSPPFPFSPNDEKKTAPAAKSSD